MSCIFCEIVARERKSWVVGEDENFLAILDLYPNTKGQTLIITKKHFSSDPLELPDGVLAKSFVFAKRIAEKIKRALGAKRVFFVIEGMEIDHFHIKLYPHYKIASNVAPEEIDFKFFEEYPGYLITLHGPRAAEEELNKIAEKIRMG